MSAPGRGYRREMIRWVGSAAIVLAAHGGMGAVITSWSDTADAGGAASAILIDLAPLSSQAAALQTNLPIGPQQDEQTEPQPEPDKAEPEQKIVDQPNIPEPPQPPAAEITVPREPPKQEQKPPPRKAAIATAPERAERIAPRQKAATAGVASINPNMLPSYASNIIRPHLLRFYNYPAGARSKSEEGVVVVSFTISRQGRLVSHRIAKSSGFAELDTEALATLERAQPFPPPPPGLNDAQFAFTLPMRYNIR